MRLCALRLLTMLGTTGFSASAAMTEDRILVLSPQVSTQPSETHAALSLAPGVYSRNLIFSGRIVTLKQLRVGSAPNPWECAWIVWNYSDNDHFYYLALKPNGWELGKRDPKYTGGQRFLASGERSFPISAWAAFSVAQRDSKITVSVNGAALARFRDVSPPVYTSGRIGFYTEDATVGLNDVTSPLQESFDGASPLSVSEDGASINGWDFPFLGHGAAAIIPVEALSP